MRDQDQVRVWLGEVADRFGRVDVLVNNAGIAPVPPSLDGVTEELYAKTMDVNFKGPMRLSGLVVEHMAPGSTIINISSKASLRPSPFTMVYAAGSNQAVDAGLLGSEMIKRVLMFLIHITDMAQPVIN